MSQVPTAARECITLMLRASDVENSDEYEAEILPLSPEAGQRVENLERQPSTPQSLEDSAS